MDSPSENAGLVHRYERRQKHCFYMPLNEVQLLGATITTQIGFGDVEARPLGFQDIHSLPHFVVDEWEE